MSGNPSRAKVMPAYPQWVTDASSEILTRLFVRTQLLGDAHVAEQHILRDIIMKHWSHHLPEPGPFIQDAMLRRPDEDDDGS